MKLLLVLTVFALTACLRPTSPARVPQAVSADLPACKEIREGNKPARCEAVRPASLQP